MAGSGHDRLMRVALVVPFADSRRHYGPSHEATFWTSSVQARYRRNTLGQLVGSDLLGEHIRYNPVRADIAQR